MSIILMLIFLSILILVHEAGHFLTAKAFGMRVDKFGFGLPIGPTLFKKKFGETTFLIHAFLLGGYVAFPDDEEDCDLPKDSPERFINKPIYQRAIVVSAGVISNVICAYFFVLITAMMWGQLPSGEANIYINDIVATKGTSIWTSGAKKGDKIVEVNGMPIKNAASFINIISKSKETDGIITKAMYQQKIDELRKINIGFKNDEIIVKDVLVRLPQINEEEKIVTSDNKVKRGLKAPELNETLKLSENSAKLRDEIRKNNKDYYIADGTVTLSDIAYAISDSVHPIDIKVERNGKIVPLKTVYPNKNGQLGIQLETKEILASTKSFPTAVVQSYKYLYDNTYMMCYGLYQLFTGKVPMKDLHGIVAITKVGGDIIENNGIFQGLLLIAIISMDLALVNFLPIPALDGGHLLFLFIEKIHGKRLDDKIVEKIGTIGFMFLVTLMVYVIFNDVFALLTNKF